MDSVIRVYEVPLRRSVKFAEWVHRIRHTARYIYNRAVSEYLFSGKYIDRVVVDTPIQKKQSKAVKICGDSHHDYAPRVSDHTIQFGMLYTTHRVARRADAGARVTSIAW